MKPIRVIVAGGRDFSDYLLLERVLIKFLMFHDLDNVEIVCGMARGADRLGFDFALDNDIDVKEFHADWEGLGNKAGPVRNAQMGDYATHLIAFWDGKSTGTKDMINYAIKKGLNVKVVRYEQ